MWVELNSMSSAYKKIAGVITDSCHISLTGDHGDCDDKVSKFLVEEAKISKIIKILIEHNYISEEHRTFPEYTSWKKHL